MVPTYTSAVSATFAAWNPARDCYPTCIGQISPTERRLSMTILPAPPEANALAVAAQWIAGVLTGPVATSLAIISIASLGYFMLNGRLDIRRGFRIVLGCFILFGAPALALGFRSATHNLSEERAPEPQIASVLTMPSHSVNNSADPYAGAAVRR